MDSPSDSIRIDIPSAPPSINHMWGHRGGRMFLTKKAREFRDTAAAAIGGAVMPDGWNYCAVSIVITPPRRRCDIDNRVKALLDALTHSGFWDDDERAGSLSVRFTAPEKGNKAGRTVVNISELGEKYGRRLE